MWTAALTVGSRPNLCVDCRFGYDLEDCLAPPKPPTGIDYIAVASLPREHAVSGPSVNVRVVKRSTARQAPSSRAKHVMRVSRVATRIVGAMFAGELGDMDNVILQSFDTMV
jgi:hypothetical protein